MLDAAIGFAGAVNAQTYYSISGGSGQAQIGSGLPLPIQVNKTTMGGPIGTGNPPGRRTPPAGGEAGPRPPIGG